MKNLANIGKVRVLKSLLAVNASLRIVHQQFLSFTHPSSSYRQQIQRQRIHSGNKRVERFGGIHGRVAVPLGVCVQLGHRRQSGGPQLLEDNVTLVGFVLSREDGSAVVELYSLLSTREGTRKDAAATPERYHSVTTSLVYLRVKGRTETHFFTGIPDARAKPKSPSFNSPSWLINKFWGLRSL